MMEFKKIKRMLDKLSGMSEVKINDTILNEIKERDEQILKLRKHIDTMNKTSIDIDKRYLEIVEETTGRSKLTINPRDGRCTLKISHKIESENIKNELIKFTKDIMKFDFPPVTFRGNFDYSDTNNRYFIVLQNESRRFKEKFNMSTADMITKKHEE